MPASAADLPQLPDEFWAIVDDGLATLALSLTPPAREAVDRHVRLLMAWNEQINLTALRAPEQIARGHVLDSLLPVNALRRLTRGRPPSVLDLGSGGGFPGLPLAAVLPARRAALVDSIGKKARFLGVAATAVRDAFGTGEAQLVADGAQAAAEGAPAAGEGAPAGAVPEIAALAERAEDLADDPNQRETWDLVVARAVGTVAEVAEIGLPLARVRGHVAIWKRDAGGDALEREVAEARRVAQACGGGNPRKVALTAADAVGLPGHCLVVIDKRRPTPDRYPRSPGERRRAA